MAAVSNYSVARLKFTTFLYSVLKIWATGDLYINIFLQKCKEREMPSQQSPDMGINIYLEKYMTIDADLLINELS